MDLAVARTDAARTGTLAGLALSAGLVSGLALVERGPTQALAIIVLPAIGYAVLRSLWVAFAGVVAIVCLLPYAVLPTGASVTPALLEVALLSAFGLTAAVVLLDRRVVIPTGLPQAMLAGLIGVTTAAFLLGLGRGYSTQTLHDFFKFLLGMATFFLVTQLVRTLTGARLLLTGLVAGVSLSAFAGLLLYAGGASLTERVLVRLVPYGYPGSRIARYIEDDPARAMRAVGTSVDPNSYGGLLMIGFVLAAGQLVVRRRTLPPGVSLAACAVIAPALALTYSRGAWMGALAGLFVVVALRRPRWLVPSALFGIAAIAAGVGSGFVERLWLGFTLQDPATKLRISEYENAWRIIQQHPWFGVGFGDAGSIELQAGVSSTYLTIAERAGLIGLAMFVVTVGIIFWRGLRAGWRETTDEATDMTLCWTAALVAALTVGLVDHYFFNPPFAHMATLFWLVAGAVTCTSIPFEVASSATRGRRFALSSRRMRTRLSPPTVGQPTRPRASESGGI
jgi:polysaccharide biosynthesis protein PslJ